MTPTAAIAWTDLLTGDDQGSLLREAIRLGVGIALAVTVAVALLMVVVGPLISADYRVESLILLGTIPVLLGAALLLFGVELPDWWVGKGRKDD